MVSRLPEFKSFEELELPKHSKVKRQSSTSNDPELERQPDVTVAEWKNRPTQDILQKLQVRRALVWGGRHPEGAGEGAGRRPGQSVRRGSGAGSVQTPRRRPRTGGAVGLAGCGGVTRATAELGHWCCLQDPRLLPSPLALL